LLLRNGVEWVIERQGIRESRAEGWPADLAAPIAAKLRTDMVGSQYDEQKCMERPS
jgi:hypothetical protein